MVRPRKKVKKTRYEEQARKSLLGIQLVIQSSVCRRIREGRGSKSDLFIRRVKNRIEALEEGKSIDEVEPRA